MKGFILRDDIPRPKESLLLAGCCNNGLSPKSESLLSSSGNLNGELSFVGDFTLFVGEAGPGDLKLRLLLTLIGAGYCCLG